MHISVTAIKCTFWHTQVLIVSVASAGQNINCLHFYNFPVVHVTLSLRNRSFLHLIPTKSSAPSVLVNCPPATSCMRQVDVINDVADATYTCCDTDCHRIHI